MQVKLGIKEIEKILPHRHPFLLVDCITELEPGVRAEGYKAVSFDESYFRGHFPDEPVMPGVLIIEAGGKCRQNRLLRRRGSRTVSPQGGAGRPAETGL